MKSLYLFNENFSSDAQIKKIENLIEDFPSFQEDSLNKGFGKNNQTSVFETKLFFPLVEPIIDAVHEANDNVFGFDLKSKPPETFNLNIYKKNQQYPYHIDFSGFNSMYDLKLTAVLNITKNNIQSKGGDFELFLGENVIIKEMNSRGCLIIFPSIWYHRVTEILAGERRTISFWFRGNLWK